MKEFIIESPFVYVGRFLFKAFRRTDNFHELWEGVVMEATRTKAKFVMLVSADVDASNYEGVVSRIKEHMGWVKSNSYLITESGNLIIINLDIVRRYGSVGSTNYNDFLIWLREKVRSEGHRVAQIDEAEFIGKSETVQEESLLEQFQKKESEDEDQKKVEDEEKSEHKADSTENHGKESRRRDKKKRWG